MTRILPRAAAASLLWALAAFPVEPKLEADRYLNDVKYLASDALKGRATGSPELEKAADYIAREFKKAGLKPVDGKSYFQRFPVTTDARLGKANHLEVHDATGRHKLEVQKDYIPFNFSAPGKFTGQVVFAGYGITAKEFNYDDYDGLNVKDKIVLILRHEPQEFDEKSVFAGKSYTEHAQFASKAFNARIHGAKGVIVINDVAAHPSETDQLEKFGRTVGPANAGIAFVHMKAEVAEGWLKAAGKDLKQIEEAIDKDLKPQSFALAESLQVDMNVQLEREQKTVKNVVGYLPGETDEYVIFGAHYDHLGLGDQHSLAPSEIGKPHHGADDNASGTAGVLELARYFGGQPKQKRGMLFLTFAGEELGLLGSSHYVNAPLLPNEKAVAMINMDMIGRIREHKVYLGGVPTGTTFKTLVDEWKAKTDLQVDFGGQGGSYGSSDHTAFESKQIPFLFVFSGLHGDYHKPSDTWDKINSGDAAKLLTFVAGIGGDLAKGGERPVFVKVAPPKMPSGGGSGGYGPYFGSIPDFAEVPNGVRFSDVREGSPAAKAGLRGGDILVEFDGKPIQNLYDYTYALRARKPGDTIEVKVLRGGQPLKVQVTLAERK